MGFFSKSPEEKLVKLYERGALTLGSMEANRPAEISAIKSLAERNEIRASPSFASACSEITTQVDAFQAKFGECQALDYKSKNACDTQLYSILKWDGFPSLQPQLGAYEKPKLNDALGFQAFFCD